MNKEVRLYPYATNDINRFMYELLNLRPPQMVVDIDGNDANNAISLELLPELDTDYLLINAGFGPSSRQNSAVARKRFETMQRDPLWESVPAVRAHGCGGCDDLERTRHHLEGDGDGCTSGLGGYTITERESVF